MENLIKQAVLRQSSSESIYFNSGNEKIIITDIQSNVLDDVLCRNSIKFTLENLMEETISFKKILYDLKNETNQNRHFDFVNGEIFLNRFSFYALKIELNNNSVDKYIEVVISYKNFLS